MPDHARRRAHALAAATSVAAELGLRCDAPVILKDSNNTIVHLAPSPVVAKVATSSLRPDGKTVLARELDVGRFLLARAAPIAPRATEVAPGPHVRGDAVLTLWAFVESDPDVELSDEDLGDALRRFHRAFAPYPRALPDFLQNLDRARDALEDRRRTAMLRDDDRAFLLAVADALAARVGELSFERRPLHGDPHVDGNVLKTARGPVLVDFEGACAGPYEWDLTSLPRARPAYAGADDEILGPLTRMRSLCVAAWCWAQYGRAPEVTEAAHVHLGRLRADG